MVSDPERPTKTNNVLVQTHTMLSRRINRQSGSTVHGGRRRRGKDEGAAVFFHQVERAIDGVDDTDKVDVHDGLGVFVGRGGKESEASNSGTVAK